MTRIIHPGRSALLLLILFGLTAVRAARTEEPEDHHHHSEQEGMVVLSPEDIADFGIIVAEAGPGTIVRTLAVPGEIHPNDDKLAHLVPRYEGIVTEVRARVGQQVREGDVLAVIESDGSLTPYPLRTHIGGTVIAKHITLGEAASRDRAPFVVADLDTVWLDLFVNQRDLHLLRTGRTVRVEHRPTGATVTGTISYIAPVLDESSRTATARVILDNRAGSWKPGMFVTGLVEVERRTVPVAVPRAAVFTLHGHPTVFVVHEGGFAPREVVPGAEDADLVEVASGLESGESYVEAGGFTLKAELEKTTFDDGHNH